MTKASESKPAVTGLRGLVAAAGTALILIVSTHAAQALESHAIGAADGSFESGIGGGSGIATTGDARWVPNFGVLLPTHGGRAVVLTTEPSAGSLPTDADAASLSIDGVTVPAGQTSLRLDYSFLTDESNPSPTNDNLEVKLVLTSSSGEEVLLSVDTYAAFSGAAWTGYRQQSGIHTMQADVSAYTGDTFRLEVRVTDVGDGRKNSAVFLDNLRFAEPGHPVANSSILYAEIAPGTNLDFDGSGSTDSNGTIAEYFWNFGNGYTGIGPFIVGVPYADEGIFQGFLRVTDNDGNQDNQPFIVVVGPENRAPVIASAPILTAREDSKYQYDVEATDPEEPYGDTLSYALTESPEGMSIDPLTGLIEWTPDAVSVVTNPVTVEVTDSRGLSTTQSFSVEVDRSTFIIATDDASNIYYARSRGDGTWESLRWIEQLEGTIRGAAIADFDRDGDLDFLIPSDQGSVFLWLFKNDGNDNFTNSGIVSNALNVSAAYGMTAGDYNEDGWVDVIVNHTTDGYSLVLNNQDGSFSGSFVDLNLGSGRGIDTADINHDGHLDIFRARTGGGEGRYYFGDGTGSFADQGVVSNTSDPYGVTLADFNNDGLIDLLQNWSSTGDTYFFAGTYDSGTDTYGFAAGAYESSSDFNNHGAFDNYDFNGDGFQDLIASSHTSRVIRYYPGNGDGTFGSPVQIGGSTSSNTLGIAAPFSTTPVGVPFARILPDQILINVGQVSNRTADLNGDQSTDDGNIALYEWDFDDGDAISGPTEDNVSHVYPDVEQSYYPQLRVTDDGGRVGVAYAEVKVRGAPPVADAGGPYIFGEANANNGIYSVQLDGTGSFDHAGIVRYEWDIENRFVETFDDPLLNEALWSQAGVSIDTLNRRAQATGTGSWGGSHLVTSSSFARIPHGSFRGRVLPLTSGTNNMMWGLKDTGTNQSFTAYHYAIYFNGGTIRIYESGSHRGAFSSYSTGTQYDVRIDLFGYTGARYYIRPTGDPNDDNDTAWVNIYNSVHSTINPVRLGATLHAGTFQFDNFSTPEYPSTAEQPSVTLFRPGTYAATLTVTDAAMQTSTETTTVTVAPGDFPVADAGGPYNLTEANASCNVWTANFNGSGSSDDNGIASYTWLFGDDTTGTGVSPSHAYSGQTSRTVVLNVADHALQGGIDTTTVTMNPGAPPVADAGGPYSVDETAASQGFWTVQFNGSGSTDDNGICDYVWDFGDGSTGSGQSPSHQYAAEDTYTVTLTVRDHAHQSHSATAEVTVISTENPVAEAAGPYEVDESIANAGSFTIMLDGSGSTDVHGLWRWDWDFDDGSSGSGETVQHTFAIDNSSGNGVDTTYTPTLTVTDNARLTNQDTAQVIFHPLEVPVADAGPDVVVEVGQPFMVDASGSTDDYGIISYSWDFEDGMGSVDDDFSQGLNNVIWNHTSNVFVAGGEARASGGSGGWNNTRLITNATFERMAGDEYIMKVRQDSGGWMMIGLKNTNNNYEYTQYPYAIYFSNGALNIYEDGSSRGSVGSYSFGTDYEIRIVVKETAGATYYIRTFGSSSWTQLYDSNHSSLANFRFGMDRWSGDFAFDDFRAPDGKLPVVATRTTLPKVTASYHKPGTYQATVTVTDNALQQVSDTAIVTVVQGVAPVANAGGPYDTYLEIPTRFSGRGSTDDFGIKWYTWDFGDGESLRVRNPWVDHRYTELPQGSSGGCGDYTATLTVEDFSGQSDTQSFSVRVCDAPVVAAVPWAFSGGIEVPHDVISGKVTTLKAVAWSGVGTLSYSWDFGDGSQPASGTVSNKRAIEVSHTYTGVDGRNFQAVLTVTDQNGQSATDTYNVRVRSNSLDIEINIAIDEGLWHLHKDQFRGQFNAGTYGNARIDSGWWDNTGGWSTDQCHTPAGTSSGLQAFEINAHLETGDVLENPYVETVSRALRYLMSRTAVESISQQPYGDPDTNGNGIGITSVAVCNNRPPYELGQVMDALVASAGRQTYAITGPTNVIHRSYFDIVTDMVDQHAYGQNDSGTGRGSYVYSWNGGRGDNSVAQWAAIGMMAAEDVWGIQVPQFVKSETDIYLNYSYNGTGFGYASPGNGTNTTPSGMVQINFVGAIGYDDPNTPEDERDPRWVTAENYIANRWSRDDGSTFWEFNNTWGPGTTSAYSYYGYYAFTKAMRLARPQPVVNLGATGLDWFRDPEVGIARRLIDRQRSDGSWPTDGNPGGRYVGDHLTQAWSIIMLTPTLFFQPPQAVAGQDRIWGVFDPNSPDDDPDLALSFDGSQSFHLDPLRTIVNYEWDLDGDGTFDTSGSDPTAQKLYTVQDYPEATLPRNITVSLRVTDNNVPPQTDTDTLTVTLAIPPHPPVAVISNGAQICTQAVPCYVCTAGLPCQLDGSQSFDIDPTDRITAWEWDLDNDGSYDDATGATPTATFPNPTSAALQISLRVTDDAVLNDINGDGIKDPEERLEDFEFTSVSVVPNEPPVASANGPYSIDEGQDVTLDGSGSSDPNGDPIVAYEWDLNDDGAFDDATGPNPVASGVTFFPDDGLFTVRLRVTDSLLDHTATSTVTVNNVAPIVSGLSFDPVNPGDELKESFPHRLTGNFTDPGSLDTHEVVVDWGDGTSDTILNYTSGERAFSADHTYVDNGIYTIIVTVTDDDTGVGQDSLQVTVENDHPIVDVYPDQTITEGDSVSVVNLGFTDPGVLDEPHTAIVDWGDGASDPATVDQTGDTVSAGPHTYVEDSGPGVYTATVSVTDKDGGVGSSTFDVTVLNAAPVVEAGPGATITEGDTFNLAPSSFTDAGVQDTHTATIDWGDGTVEAGVVTESNGAGTVAGSHMYANNGTFTVTVTVTDDESASGSDTLVVTVENAALLVEAGADRTITEGDAISLVGAGFQDAGVNDTHTASINWGDGTVEPAAVDDNADTVAAGPHTYQEDGTYSAVLTVTDDSNDSGSDGFQVTVLNAAPIVEAGPDATISAGGTFSLAPSTFTDAGVLDTHTATINWGDGASDTGAVTQGAGSGSVAGGHTYPTGGVFTVVVTVTDDDGASGNDTLTLTVESSQEPPEQTIDDLVARAKDSKIDIVWTHVQDADFYRIWMSLDGGSNWTMIEDNYWSDYSVYAHFGLSNGTEYCYKVTSMKSGVESLDSNVVCATPAARTRTRRR